MTDSASGFVSIGRPLATALNETPSLTLSFYSYGLIARHCDGNRVSEYAVNPAQIATALSDKTTFDTGLLSGDTLFMRQEGVKRIIAEYRPPQMTGLFLDGAENALRIPLPGLVLIRAISDGSQPKYALYAVKRRPTDLDAALFHAPLPNVFGGAGICWGSVPKAAPLNTSLAGDWAMLLGSSFGNHACGGKSKAFPQDIRQQWIALEAGKKRRYPTRDLIAAKTTFGKALEAMTNGRV
jgi:hypothetical protein